MAYKKEALDPNHSIVSLSLSFFFNMDMDSPSASYRPIVFSLVLVTYQLSCRHSQNRQTGDEDHGATPGSFERVPYVYVYTRLTLTTFGSDLSFFALECMAYASQRRKGPTSPASDQGRSDGPQSTALTLLSQDSDTTVVSPHAVSGYERTSYYNGVTDDGEHPDLLYRTGSAKYPWILPAGRHAHPPPKSLRGVHGTPLNRVWSTVGPQVRDMVRSGVRTRYTINPARFVTHGEDRQETLGPVVIWVGVYPHSTSPDTAYKVSQSILALLEKNGVEDVEVEWHESVLWKAAGPALLRVVGTNNPTAHVRRHLTAVLGMPIATEEREEEDAQGSVGFFFHENRDQNGIPSTRVFGVSNRHVLRKKSEGTYEFNGAGAPRQFVRLNGLHRFQRGLDDIKVAISERGTLADLYTREIIALEAKGTNEEEDAEEDVEEDAKELRKTRQNLDEQKEAIASLETLYKDIKAQWGDIGLRNIGHVHYSPPISVDLEDEGYTEDWGTFEVDEAKFKAQFVGNVVDLGAFGLAFLLFTSSDTFFFFLFFRNRDTCRETNGNVLSSERQKNDVQVSGESSTEDLRNGHPRASGQPRHIRW